MKIHHYIWKEIRQEDVDKFDLQPAEFYDPDDRLKPPSLLLLLILQVIPLLVFMGGFFLLATDLGRDRRPVAYFAGGFILLCTILFLKTLMNKAICIIAIKAGNFSFSRAIVTNRDRCMGHSDSPETYYYLWLNDVKFSVSAGTYYNYYICDEVQLVFVGRMLVGTVKPEKFS